MHRSLLLALVFLALVALVCSAAPAPEDTGPWFIDLSPHVNVKLTDSFHSDANNGNNLAKLPTGKQTFAEMKFNVGTGVIQLGSAQVQGKPAKVEGIKVDHFVGKLRIMHAAGFQGGDNQVIAKYVVHYDDKSTADIEIAYGRDVVDWW